MNDLQYTPPFKRTVPLVLLGIACFCCIVSAVCLMLSVGEKIVWQCLFIVFAVMTVYVTVRYFVSKYTYHIEVEHGLFVVIETKGRRQTPVCRLELSTLIDVTPFSREKTKGIRSLYTYCHKTVPEMQQLLFFEDAGGRIAVCIECDGEFLDMLKTYAALPHDPGAAETEGKEE